MMLHHKTCTGTLSMNTSVIYIHYACIEEKQTVVTM